MENQFVWNDRYNIGVDIIDRQHQKLFRILNKLFHFGQLEEKSQWVCQEAIKYFKDHTLEHFQDEEDYMASIDYPGLEMHKRIHSNFREVTLPALEKELKLTGYSKNAVNHFLGVCAGWLIGHTLTEDPAIVSGETIKQWDNLLPEEEQAIMGQTIISQLNTMFQLDSRLIDNCYCGEKFGDGIYLRLVYTTKEEESWEFLLVFEEQLIISTLGSVIRTKSKAISVMLMNAARYTARQFVEHIKRHFPSLEPTGITEQLLTYEQFRKAFERDRPQFSLLFDTGKGYFAYCMTTSDTLPSEEKEALIVTENAMEQVKKYLSQNQAEKMVLSQKKKVLIVDDSDQTLKAMRQLLGDEYEVLTALSGFSAFSSITINRPDLILLDYEMPICNGRQVLEIIRGEKNFADIPIIFWIKNVDRDSIKSALALKPQGYLAKSLSPELVKKGIDHFFEKEYLWPLENSANGL